MKWCEAITLEFVKIYLEHEVLWNPENVGYRSKGQRDKAYADIAVKFKSSSCMSLTIQDVKTKIRNLRTTYQQQIQKILQKSSPDRIYEPTLVWFSEMDKCLKNISNRHSSSNMQIHETSEANSSKHMWAEEDAKIKEEIYPDPLFPQTDDESVSSKLDHQNPEIYRSQKKRKKKNKHKEQNLNIMTLDPSSKLENLEDEFDIYGKYIASQLRKMDLQKALRLQLEIQSLISEARISDFLT